jgi:hypothetical protein
MKYRVENSTFRMDITKPQVKHTNFRVETTYEVSEKIQATETSVKNYIRNASVAQIRNLK